MRLGLYILLLSTFSSMLSCASSSRAQKSGLLTIFVAGDFVFLGRTRNYGADGLFQMVALNPTGITCRGRYKYDEMTQGRGKFWCSDSRQGRFRVETDGWLRSYGKGSSSFGDVEVLIGYSVHEINRRAHFPKDQILMVRGSAIGLSTRPISDG